MLIWFWFDFCFLFWFVSLILLNFKIKLFFFLFVWLCEHCFTKLCCWLLECNEKKVFVNWFRLVYFIQLKWTPLANSNKTVPNSMFTLWHIENPICFAGNNCDDTEMCSFKWAQQNFFSMHRKLLVFRNEFFDFFT